MRSSYIRNNYGEVFEKYVAIFDPYLLIELGVLDGYSTMHIAKALKSSGSQFIFDAYDLFDDYEYKHGKKKEVEEVLAKEGVSGFVNLLKGDAYKVHSQYENNSVDFLHIDISNTGKVIRDLLTLWHPKISQHGVILLEGGSEERDRVGWMQTYKMEPIKAELESNPLIAQYYMWSTYQKFPSMTVLIRNDREYQESSEMLYGNGW